MKQSKKASLLDANVILRFVLGDDAVQSPKAYAFMKRLESADELAELEDVILAETIWVLEKRAHVPRFEITRTLSDLLAFPGIRYRGKRVGLQALTFFGSTNCDIADCLLAARAKSKRAKVVSFDYDFDKLGCDWESPP
jgi:predicted nucleic-acid-binding protein